MSGPSVSTERARPTHIVFLHMAAGIRHEPAVAAVQDDQPVVPGVQDNTASADRDLEWRNQDRSSRTTTAAAGVSAEPTVRFTSSSGLSAFKTSSEVQSHIRIDR